MLDLPLPQLIILEKYCCYLTPVLSMQRFMRDLIVELLADFVPLSMNHTEEQGECLMLIHRQGQGLLKLIMSPTRFFKVVWQENDVVSIVSSTASTATVEQQKQGIKSVNSGSLPSELGMIDDKQKKNQFKFSVSRSVYNMHNNDYGVTMKLVVEKVRQICKRLNNNKPQWPNQTESLADEKSQMNYPNSAPKNHQLLKSSQLMH